MIAGDALITKILKKLKEPSSDGHWSRTEMLQEINLSLQQLRLKIPNLLIDTDESLTTVASQANYTIPSDVGNIIAVRIDGEEIDITTKKAIGRDSQRGIYADDWQGDEIGQPAECYIQKGILYLQPKPSTSYAGKTISIDHELIFTDVTDSASSYPFESVADLAQAQRLIFFDVVMQLAADDDDMNKFATQKQLYEEGIQDLITKKLVMVNTGDESLMKAKGEEDDEGSISFSNQNKMEE